MVVGDDQNRAELNINLMGAFLILCGKSIKLLNEV